MLCRCYLVVLGLSGNAKLPELLVDCLHVSTDALTDGAEVVVVQLLALRRHGTEQGAAGVDQIFSL